MKHPGAMGGCDSDQSFNALEKKLSPFTTVPEEGALYETETRNESSFVSLPILSVYSLSTFIPHQ